MKKQNKVFNFFYDTATTVFHAADVMTLLPQREETLRAIVPALCARFHAEKKIDPTRVFAQTCRDVADQIDQLHKIKQLERYDPAAAHALKQELCARTTQKKSPSSPMQELRTAVIDSLYVAHKAEQLAQRSPGRAQNFKRA